MKVISVIVPVYNAEKYLHKCIDSILSQTYKYLEVILIDDGSSDNSGMICDQYVQKDQRVSVLHKENAGVSAARNIGLDLAKGDYITFVDSDDYLELNMYESMMRVVNQYDCEVVMCDCIKEFEYKKEKYTHDIRPGYYNRNQLEKEYFRNLLIMPNVEYPPTISNWLLLFRNNKKEKYQPRYVEGVRFSEDLLFGAQLLYQADSFYYMKEEYFYYYRMNPQSVTHNFTIDKWKDYQILYGQIMKVFSDNKKFNFNHQIDLVLLFFVYNAVGDILGTNQLQDKKRMNMINLILNDKNVRTLFRRLDVKRLPISIKQKIITYIYKYKIGLKFLVYFKN